MIYVPVVSLYSLEKRWSQLRVIHAPKWFLWWSWTECLLFPPLADRHWLLWGHSGMREWHGAWDLGPVLTSWVFCSMMGCRQSLLDSPGSFGTDVVGTVVSFCAERMLTLSQPPAWGRCLHWGCAGLQGGQGVGPSSQAHIVNRSLLLHTWPCAVLGAQPGQESKEQTQW